MRTRPSVCRVLAVFLTACLFACGSKGSETTGTEEASSGGSAPASSGGAGSEAPPKPASESGAIAGTVQFAGAAPEMPLLKRAGDPFCAKTETTDTSVVVNPNGTLANVVVRLPPGAATGAVPAEPVVISQTNCMYEPRVSAAMVQQPIQFTNADKTMHNIHAYGGNVGEPPMSVYNLVQPPGAPALARPAIGSGPMEIKCDVHPWMKAYVVVSDHPYFDTTRADGAFRIEKVPVGTYELEAWHEVYGTKTASVEVKKDGTATVAFTFGPDGAGTAGEGAGETEEKVAE